MAVQSLQQATIYGRVSTLTNQSTEMQVRDLRKLANRRGFKVLREYLDEGFSGAKGKRLGMPRVFAHAPRIAALRAQGRSWREIVSETGISKGSAQRAVSGLRKIM